MNVRSGKLVQLPIAATEGLLANMDSEIRRRSSTVTASDNELGKKVYFRFINENCEGKVLSAKLKIHNLAM